MAEVGLVPFARTARSVAEAVLPAQRSTCSKRVFTQPPLLAILCLMRRSGRRKICLASCRRSA